MGIKQEERVHCSTGENGAVPNPSAWCFGLLFLSLSCFLVALATFPGNTNIQSYSSGIFDADVSRVVGTITSFADTHWHVGKHPLFQILVTPVSLILAHLPVNQLTNARLVCVLGIALQTLCIGGIVRAACPAMRRLSFLAAALFLASFSSLLFAAIPESCAWSGLSGLLPTWFFLARRCKEVSLSEVLGWGLLLPLSMGYTITQGVFWFLALTFRVIMLGIDSGRRACLRGVLMGCLACTFGCFVVWGLANLQYMLNPLPPFYQFNPMRGQSAYMRPIAVSSLAPEALLSLVTQMLVYPFVPPVPGYSDVVKYLGYWSLSFEQLNTTPSDQLWYVDLFRMGVVFLLFGVLPFAYRAGATAAILILGICSQLALHLFYGREFVLYSLNWLGLAVALSVITASRLRPAIFRVWLVGVFMAIPLLLAWNFSVLDRALKEVSYGLDAAKRTAEGAPQGPLFSLPGGG
jgi:hypothetical protein